MALVVDHCGLRAMLSLVESSDLAQQSPTVRVADQFAMALLVDDADQ
jgi:hypothetical protein